MAKLGMSSKFYRNIGCFELPCWVEMSDPTPDLAPLRLPEFTAMMDRHDAGGDIAHVVADWLTDQGLDVVAASWKRLVNEGKGDRLRAYIAGILNKRAGGAEMVYGEPDPAPSMRDLGVQVAAEQNRRFWEAFSRSDRAVRSLPVADRPGRSTKARFWKAVAKRANTTEGKS
jgi:hypothetical protein